MHTKTATQLQQHDHEREAEIEKEGVRINRVFELLESLCISGCG